MVANAAAEMDRAMNTRRRKHYLVPRHRCKTFAGQEVCRHWPASDSAEPGQEYAGCAAVALFRGA
jgi:hypothetical protein